MTDSTKIKKSTIRKAVTQKPVAKKATLKKTAEKNGPKEKLIDRATRFRTIYGGKVRQEGRTQNCTILDLSASGAKIKGLKDLAGIPDNIDLVIDRLGLYRPLRSEIIWRSEEFVGVRFLNEPSEIMAMLTELMPSRLKASAE